jgi:hypothetical protein
MARTVGDVVNRTLQHLFVLVGGETAAAEDSAIVVSAFNGLVDGWFASGLTPVDDETLAAASQTALVEGTVYTTSSAFPLLVRHFEGVSAILAVMVADSFEAQVKPAVAIAATEGAQRINAAFMPSMVATVDRALRRLPDTILWPST